MSLIRQLCRFSFCSAARASGDAYCDASLQRLVHQSEPLAVSFVVHRLEDDMPEAAWLQLCASVEEDPARGLQLATFQNILSEELQVGGGPIALAHAVEELHLRVGNHGADLEGNGREQAGPSFIQDCKDYYLEQAVRYVSSPTMDEAAAKAAIARLTELSARVKRRLKYVFFELPSVRVQSSTHRAAPYAQRTKFSRRPESCK